MHRDYKDEINVDEEETEKYDVSDLRGQLKDYYGTAIFSSVEAGPYGFMPAVAETMNVDELSDEEVIEHARSNGLI